MEEVFEELPTVETPTVETPTVETEPPAEIEKVPVKKTKRPMSDERKAKLLENLAKARAKAKENKQNKKEAKEKPKNIPVDNIGELKNELKELKDLIKSQNTARIKSKKNDEIEDVITQPKKIVDEVKEIQPEVKEIQPVAVIPNKNIRSTISKYRLF